jgi:imidazolonepropionase-like amidohydrolase
MNKRYTSTILLASALVVAAVFVGRAEAPHVYAITGARIVTAAGAPIESGTVLVRNGLIEAVGPGTSAPADAVVIDGKGLCVYPGLIDMGNSSGLVMPAAEAPRDARTRMEIERARRQSILRPQLEAAACLRADAPELRRLAGAGITTVLSVPTGEMIKGRSSLINVVAPDDEPQIGNVAGDRRGLYVVRTPVALHVSFPAREAGGGYPASLMGVIAFVRQAFLDGGHYQLEMAHASRVKAGAARPAYDASLEALQPALSGRMPVAFQAGTANEIRRALGLAKEFKLDPIVTGALEADAVAADLKAEKARVIYSLNFPVRSRTLAPDADEPVRVLRARANAPKVPGALEKAGVVFAFESGGLTDPRDFVRNAARAVKAGLPAAAAIRALTINAATMAGAADRTGSIEKGKIANLVITDGDLFGEKTIVKQVFIDGRPVPVDTAPPSPARRGGRGGQ